jgi:NSS family neurotransmitter:Na+ symporter
LSSETGNTPIKSLWLLTVLGLGAALGYSNLLDFPVMIGLHGGSAYLLVFFLCQMFIALPVMLSEMFLGRRSRADALTGWQELSVGRVVARSWRFVGLAMLVAGLLTIAAYSVLFSWSALYLDAFWAGTLTQETDFTRYFMSVMHQTDLIGLVQLGFFGLLSVLLLIGFRFGLVPVMLVMVASVLLALISGVYMVTGLDGDAISEAITRVFGWRPEQITKPIFFKIVNQAFFSLGIGVGALWLTGAAAHAKASLGKVVLLIMAFDLAASLLAAMTLWQLDLDALSERWSFAELLFQQLPRLMDNDSIMLFFGAMVLTGLASTLLILENLVRAVSARLEIGRLPAILLVVVIALGLGVAGQMSFNRWQYVMWYGRSIYDNYVMISSDLLVPLSGAMVAIFVGWVMRSADARDEWQPTRVWRFWAWRWSLRIVSIVAILLVFFGALEQQFGLHFQQAAWAVILVVLAIISLRLVRNFSR